MTAPTVPGHLQQPPPESRPPPRISKKVIRLTAAVVGGRVLLRGAFAAGSAAWSPNDGSTRARMRRLRRAIGAVLVMCGLAAGTVMTAAPVASASAVPVVYGSRGGGLGWSDSAVKPGAFYWGTGGTLFVRPLSWSSWVAASAYGRGTRWWDTCKPNCAQGTYWKSPASITLWGVASHNGVSYFSHLTLRWTTRNGVRHKQRYIWSILPGATVPGWN